jgi:hypothetical protein
MRTQHAWTQFTHEGKTYVFNGNDGEDGIHPDGGYPPSADGSPDFSSDIIRPLLNRETKIQVIDPGLCFMVAAGLSSAYRNMPWKAFLKFAMTCSELDLYNYLEKNGF